MSTYGVHKDFCLDLLTITVSAVQTLLIQITREVHMRETRALLRQSLDNIERVKNDSRGEYAFAEQSIILQTTVNRLG